MHSNRFHYVTWAMSIHCCSDATIYRFQYGQISLLFHPNRNFLWTICHLTAENGFRKQFQLHLLIIFIYFRWVAGCCGNYLSIMAPFIVVSTLLPFTIPYGRLSTVTEPILCIAFVIVIDSKARRKNHFVNFNFDSSDRHSQFIFCFGLQLMHNYEIHNFRYDLYK